MVFVFDILSPENPDFKRLIHICPEHTFEDFHRIIQNAVGFDPSQLASFFLTDEHWRKQIEISILGIEKTSLGLFNMRKIVLKEYLNQPGQKLVYVFDFFNDRFFYLELKEKLMETVLKEPFVAYEKGSAPAQFFVNDYDSPEVELLDRNESYKSFGDLEDYYEIFGEVDA